MASYALDPGSMSALADARRELGCAGLPSQEREVVDIQLAHAMKDLGDWQAATKRVALERIGAQGNPSLALQIARNEIALKALTNEAMGQNPSEGVTYGELDHWANLAHLAITQEKEIRSMASITEVKVDADTERLLRPRFGNPEDIAERDRLASAPEYAGAESREAERRRERADRLREAVDSGEKQLKESPSVKGRTTEAKDEREAPEETTEPKRLSFFESIRERIETWTSAKEQRAVVSSRPAPTAEETRDAVMAAQSQGRDKLDAVMSLPGVDTEREAQKILRSADRRERLFGLIPEKLRNYFGINTGDEWQKGYERAYDKLVDTKGDNLLAQQQKAAKVLANVDLNQPLHRLSSAQYRAVQTFIRTEEQLKQLRPLTNEDYARAAGSAGAGRAVTQQLAERAVTSDGVSARPLNQHQLEAPVAHTAAVESSAAVTEARRMQENRERALAAVRELQNGVQPDGYQTPAQKAMAAKIITQLNEGRDSLNLSTRYAMGDHGAATETHQKAVQANMPLIEAVRRNGVPVDTGKVSVVDAQKKSVEVSEGLNIGL